MGAVQVQPPTGTYPKHFGPLKGWGGGWDGGSGGQPNPDSPTYLPQNDPLIALTILKTHAWGF